MNESNSLIRQENEKPGTRDWLLAKTYIDPDTWWRSPGIEGYCSETSVSAGDTLKIMVSTNPVSEFELEIFRVGYYGGDGGRSMMKFESIQGKIQPDPPIGENRLRECKWEPSVEFEIPSDWLSGVYLGKLTAKKEGLQSYIIFIVRDDRPCDLLFQCSDMTWQAYNSWPDDRWSLYHNDKEVYNPNGRKKWSTDPNETGWVSFDRPYANFCQNHLVDRPNSVGSGEFLLWEYPLSYWMEQQGYDVSYISNVDTHTDGTGLQRAKGFISVGHDEYWTREMFDSAGVARDAGVNLAFLSGNTVLGVVPLLPSAEGQPHRIMRREGYFVGDAYAKRYPERKLKYPMGPDGALLMGGRHAGIGGGNFICTRPDHWLYEGTDMKEGDAINGLVGWEWNGYPARDLPGHEILATSNAVDGKNRPDSSHVATIYNGPKDNVVFNAASIWYVQGVSSPPGHVLPANRFARPQGPDARVQRMTANLFDRFIQTDLQSHGVTQNQIASLAEIMRQAVQQDQIAGGSFLVAHKGEIVFREAFGYADIEAKRPFTTDELLPIASVSKPFMASVVMALVEQGKVNLDDPVEKYLSEFKGKKVEGNQTPARPMTIRHLLSHTAGFWGNQGITPEKMDLIRNFERPLAEAVNGIAEYDLVYEPGTKWIYSGTGYCVLGRVAEVALGQSLEEIAQDALFRPLGLNNTTFLPSIEARKTVPTGYLRQKGKLQRQRSMAEIEDFRFILSGGSLFTTLDELAVFGQMHLNDGVFDGKRILSRASISEMRRLQSPDRPRRTYGLGWFRGDVSESGLADLVFHGGAWGAHFRIDRRRELVCAFLVYQNAVQVQDLKDRLIQQVYEMFPAPKGR